MKDSDESDEIVGPENDQEMETLEESEKIKMKLKAEKPLAAKPKYGVSDADQFHTLNNFLFNRDDKRLQSLPKAWEDATRLLPKVRATKDRPAVSEAVTALLDQRKEAFDAYNKEKAPAQC